MLLEIAVPLLLKGYYAMRAIRKEQLEFLKWEMGVFFHFGIRTFFEGHQDWDMREMPLDRFNPVKLDCEQWIKTVKEGGARYAILVCKHHDGFANWPSAYTEYSVKNTPWKDGKGDVVRDFTNACRKYDIKVGLYYSPAQFGSAKMNAKEYDDYFINQISELLTNYGKIDYLWFDGCGSENHEYDTVRITKEIRRMQPDILIFNMWDPDTRWVGNESGIAPMPNYTIQKDLDFSIRTEDKDVLEDERFLPAECDCRMRLTNWFFSENDFDTVKSVDELMGLYYYSVGRGSNLLLNLCPDRRGLIPGTDAERFIEFGNKIKEVFSNSLAGMKETTKENNTYTTELAAHTLVNTVVIEEDVSDGEKADEFSVYVYPYPYGKRVLVFKGYTIGYKRICSFPTIRTQKIDIVIDKANAPCELDDIRLYYVK